MVDIDSIEMCFIDFDDSLAVRVNREPEPDYHDSMVMGDWRFFDRVKRAIGKGMVEFTKTLHTNKALIFVLTWGNSSLRRKAELEWCNHRLGDDVIEDVIVTSSKEYKIEVLTQFANAYNMDRNKILLIDDIPDTLDRAYEAGFSVASPQEIALIYG